MSAPRLSATEVYRGDDVVCIAVSKVTVDATRYGRGWSVYAARAVHAVVLRQRDDVRVTWMSGSPANLASLCETVPGLAQMLALR